MTSGPLLDAVLERLLRTGINIRHREGRLHRLNALHMIRRTPTRLRRTEYHPSIGFGDKHSLAGPLIAEETAFWGHRHDDPSSRRNRQPSSDRRNGTSSVLNSEQDLDSIPTARGGLSRLAIARLKSAGVPMAPLLRCVGTDAAIVDLEPVLILSVGRAAVRFQCDRYP